LFVPHPRPRQLCDREGRPDGKPVEGMQVHIERDGAAPVTGETNAAGEGPKVKGDRLELLKVTFKKLLK
jgi:type VI secretion system secreted protein VgrG